VKLRVADVTFSYDSHPVLANISFSLAQGRVLAVLGMNGAGKSTLLKCMNGVLRPQGGAVLVDNVDLLRLSPRSVARRIGYVPQRHPETGMTVFETVLMGRRPHIQWSMGDRDYELAEKTIHDLGLSHLSMRRVTQLSGGELQKVVIARALAQSPEVLLLDEPTSNLDLKNQLEVMGLLQRIVETQNLSAVVAVHDLNMAVRFADDLLFLKDHRIHAVCDAAELSAQTIQQVYDVEVELHRIGKQMIVVPQTNRRNS